MVLIDVGGCCWVLVSVCIGVSDLLCWCISMLEFIFVNLVLVVAEC